MKVQWSTGITFDLPAEDENSLQLLIFDRVTILRATNNFCDSNKLGEGGFGPVYKVEFSLQFHTSYKRTLLFIHAFRFYCPMSLVRVSCQMGKK